MDRRRAWMAGVAVVLFAGGGVTSYVALHYAASAHNDLAYFLWVVVVAPLLGGAVGWRTRRRDPPAEGRGARATVRLLVGAALGVLLADAGAVVAGHYTTCRDYLADDCGISTIGIGALSVGLAVLLLFAALIVRAVGSVTERSSRASPG